MDNCTHQHVTHICHDHSEGCCHDHGDSCCHESHSEGCSCCHDHAPSHKDLWLAGIGGVLLVIGGLTASHPVSVYILLAAFAVSASDILWSALWEMVHGEIFGEKLLMSIAGVGAVLIGQLTEGVMIFLLFRIGEYLQARAVHSSRKSISALMDIRPDRANVLQNGVPVTLAAEDVSVGDIILVRPGERIPLDAVVVRGSGCIDASTLTGESIPRQVSPACHVPSGCVALDAALELKVERPFGESAASRILSLVEDAAKNKAPSEKLVTRFARIYTPLVTGAAVLIAAIPPLFGWLPLTSSVYSALCFLTISCPCALVISVPLTFFAGIGRASRAGVLVKGGSSMEALAHADIVAFDKTGTLTEGQFSVTEWRPAAGISRETLQTLAATAEQQSNHPIARCIVSSVQGDMPSATGTFHEVSGRGVTLETAGRILLAGSRAFLTDAGIAVPDSVEPLSTAVYIAENGAYMGAVLLRDQPKETSAAAIDTLKSMGIQRTVLLSGDNEQTAAAVGQELCIDEVQGQLLPENKLSALNHLRTRLAPRGSLLFVGDGINDTPALAGADLGIAMGGLGSDAAVETADVVIMGDDPCKLPEGIRIARLTCRIAQQNIALALVSKSVVMLLAALQLASLWMAVLADVGVCLLCIANALRVRR